MKKIFSLFAAILFAGSMMATDVTLDYSTKGYSNQQSLDGVAVVQGDVTFTLAKGSGSTAPGYYTTGTGARTYGGNTLTIDAGANTITQIDFNFTQNNKNYTVNTGTYSKDNKQWTGSASSVVFTTESGSGHNRIKAITVTYSGTAPAVTAPSISGEDNFEDETTVTITCSTDGASIYYTLDETDPTSASTLYKDPFKLTETKTVKAVAILGEDASSVASKTFTKLDRLTCAQFAALANNAVGLLDEVVVTYAASDGKNIWLKDASGALLLYYASGSYGLKAGDVVNGLKGSKTTYQTKVVELVPSKTLAELNVTEGEAPAPEELTAAPTDADINKYVVFKDVTVSGSFTEGTISNVTMTVAGASVTLRNQFKNGYAFTAGKNYDVVGLISYYSSACQVYFISAEEKGCSNEVTITKGAEENGTYELSAEKVCGDDEGGFVEVTAITPAAGYEFDEITTSASGTVDNENKKVTGITANTTITVKFKAIPKYTVTFDLGISKNQPTLTEEEGGAGVTLPAGPVPVCAEWAFAGWAEAKVASETTAAPELFKAGTTYHPADNVTLYAVYKRVEGADFDGTEGGDFYIYANVGGTNYYAKEFGQKLESTTDINEAVMFTFEKVVEDEVTYFAIKSGDVYLKYGSSTNFGTQADPYKWQPTAGEHGSWRLKASTTLEASTVRSIVYRAGDTNKFAPYGISNINGTEYFDVEIAGGTTYYFSAPSCWATSVDNTEVTNKAVKFIQNGQLFIEMNGRIYNVQGQTVK